MDLVNSMFIEKASHPTKDPSDYLVVEDQDKVTTWHLPVKLNGVANRGLAGKAWAALHEGFMGNKYEGPDADKARSRLDALYREQKWDTPSTKVSKARIS